MHGHRLLSVMVVLLCCWLAVALVRSATGQQLSARLEPADLIVINGRVTTLDEDQPEATALAIRNGVFVAVGDEADVQTLRGDRTIFIDAGGRRIIPGLNDSHLHAVRGGRFYNLELRWDGVASIQRGLEMIAEQAQRTPDGQWVRVIGGWTPYQFVERRMPTVTELNVAAPDTPVFVLFLYSQGFLNRAGVKALGLTSASKAPDGGRYEFVDGGAILHAEPSPAILYTTIARLPELTPEDQANSTRHFYRELNRFGLTSVIDPGGGGHVYPGDYQATEALAAQSKLPIRISTYLFAQQRGGELSEIEQWTSRERLNLNRAMGLLNGYVTRGAGENLVWSAGDYENFMAARPELSLDMDEGLEKAVRLLAEHHWPIRIHATYDESITRILNVLERVFAETGYTARWCIDHAETVSQRNIERIKALGGGVAIQNRMAFAGEFFVDRYGARAATSVPPIRALMSAGVPVGAGTDGTRVSSYNPWLSLYWMASGKTIGGLQIASTESRLSREEALRLYTIGSAWFSGEERVKGRIRAGLYADFTILTADYMTVPEEEIRVIESVLTVVGGDVVFSREPFNAHGPEALPAIRPEWSPVRHFGGFQRD